MPTCDHRPASPLRLALSLLAALLWCSACAAPRPGELLTRRGDEIMVCGQLFHIGAPVVLWTDPGGYDAYRVERRFAPWAESSWEKSAGENLETPNRYGLRRGALTPDQIELVRAGGWTLPQLQAVVDQFVIHYDVCGTSRQCFNILHDHRGLSVHFLLDIDGTIYQTLDLKERAWHATTSNDRSVGVEIANIGAYSVEGPDPLGEWYAAGPDGRTRITIPPRFGDGGIRTPGFIGRPAREAPVVGEIQGQSLRQYDLTPQQYESLTRLTATLCRIFPHMPLDYPRDGTGKLVREKLPDERLASYRGLIGHYHIQANKLDPGPAFQWDRVVNGAARRAK